MRQLTNYLKAIKQRFIAGWNAWRITRNSLLVLDARVLGVLEGELCRPCNACEAKDEFITYLKDQISFMQAMLNESPSTTKPLENMTPIGGYKSRKMRIAEVIRHQRELHEQYSPENPITSDKEFVETVNG